MKKILKKIADFCSDYFCLFIVIIQIILLVVISIGIINNTEDNNDCNNDSVVLASFNDSTSDRGQETFEFIYIPLDTLIFAKDNNKFVSVAPIYYCLENTTDGDVTTGEAYLYYPYTEDNFRYTYQRVSLVNNTGIIRVACMVSEYSSDLWPIEVQYSIGHSASEYVNFYSASSYTKTVGSVAVGSNGYGLSNYYELYGIFDTEAQEYFSLTSLQFVQLNTLSSTPINYSYEYQYVPLYKISGSSASYYYFLGSEQQYDIGYGVGYGEGYQDGLDTTFKDISPFTVIADGVSNFMNMEIFPNFSLGNLFAIFISIMALTIGLKLFGVG